MHRLLVAIRAVSPTGVALVTAACMTWIDTPAESVAPRLGGFGTLDFPITTSSAEAQRLFTQGMLQSYAFNEEEAVRAFKAALAEDPACAMCAWGVAYALGPNINARAHRALNEARRYVSLAEARTGGATLRERQLVEALRLRYADAQRPPPQDAPLVAEACGAAGDTSARPLDVAYARKLRELADERPDDPDVASLYAEALMIATRGPLWDPRTGQPADGVQDMVSRLERALHQTPAHTGVNHYMIHALDQSPVPVRGQRSADTLGALAPASPHLVHMPSHLYVRLARYGDARRANEEALAAERRLTERLKTQGFEPTRNWDVHNMHFLWFAALMEGRGEQALAQAREAAERHAGLKNPRAGYMRALPVLTLLRLERWEDALRESPPPHAGELELGIHDYARGVALLRIGRPASARAAAASLTPRVQAPLAEGARADDYVRGSLAILDARLQGELLAEDGDTEGAARSLQRAIELEDAHRWNEPPLLAAGSRLALGDMWLRARRWSEAEAAFRADLARQPGSGWALRGLHRALAGQARAADAARARSELEHAWAAADRSTKETLL
jgi:tetratricopeptide (TPR) repeat protein